MENIKIKVLKNFEVSPDGINIIPLKAGEILEVGSKKLTPHLMEWFKRNAGYSELYQEKKIEAAPSNKAFQEPIENKSFSTEEAVETVAEEITTKNNSKKRK